MSVSDEAGVRELIALAKREDLGAGDVTTALLAHRDESAAFRLIA